MPVYCITGTNRGIGLEFVRQLAQSPDNTILATVRSLSADLADLRAVASAKTHILECDTSDVESIRRFAGEAARVLGDTKIDFLVNNAAANTGFSQSSLELDPANLLSLVNVNVIGPAKVVEHLLGAGALARDVRVQNMTSGLSSMQFTLDQTPRRGPAYSISKAALNMLAIHQAQDLRAKLPGAVVIVMDPGWVKTRMGGAGAVLEPADSITSMLRVLHGLGDGDAAKFYHYSGRELPW